MTKRVGNIFDKLSSLENVEQAATKAKRGKKHHRGVREYEKKKDEIHNMVQSLLSTRSYQVSNYEIMKKVTDAGKEREIHKLPFCPDRIIQHCLIKTMSKKWIRSLTYDSYNCIPKRGINSKIKCHNMAKKLKRTLIEMDREGEIYVLKMDIKKFYPSVRHSVYRKSYRKDCKDKGVLWLMDTLNYSNEGLAIGNPDAQMGSHLVLRKLDHIIKEEYKVEHYFRFADDMVILSHDKKQLHEWLWRIRNYLWYELKLEMKKNYRIFPVSEGIDFGGYVFRPYYTRVRKRIKKNTIKKRNDPKSMASYMGILQHCDSKNLIKKINSMTKIGDLGIKIERRFSGQEISIQKLLDETITILDFDVRKSTKKENTLWVMMQVLYNGEKRIVKGGYEIISEFLLKVDKSLLPLEDVIIRKERGYFFEGTI